MKKLLMPLLPAIGLLVALAAPRSAAAQAAPAAPTAPEMKTLEYKVYTYVEQMPQLPGGGGNRAIIEAIESHVIYPSEAAKRKAEGRVFVAFVVSPDGLVKDAKVVKGIGGGCDEAVLAAVAQLPPFTPGRQAGKPVAVSFTVPITFPISAPQQKK